MIARLEVSVFVGWGLCCYTKGHLYLQVFHFK